VLPSASRNNLEKEKAMTREEAIELIGPLAEALKILTEGGEDSKAKKAADAKAKKAADAKAKKAADAKAKTEEVTETPTVDDDLFGEDDGEPAEVKTPGEVKTLVLEWIQSDPDKNRPIAQETFLKITGLEKMNKVTDKNATEVYGKLVAAFKK